MNTEKLQVIFRKEDDGQIVAFFPNVRCNYGMIQYYHPIDGHGEANIHYYINKTKQAIEKEYSALLEELKSIYYDYEIVIKKRLRGGNVAAWRN